MDATVISVNGYTALTNKGTFALGPGHHARAGQVITVPCAGGMAAGGTRQQRSKPSARDSQPFVPALHSFDSPQRPARFGDKQLPQTSPDGTFISEPGTGGLTGFMTLNSGVSIPLGESPRLDHPQQQLVTWQSTGETVTPGYSPGALAAPSLTAGIAAVKPYVFKRFINQGKEVVLAYQDFTSFPGGQRTYDVQERTNTFAGAETITTAATLINPGTVWQAKIVFQTPQEDWLAAREYQILSKWRLIPQGILRLRTLRGRFGIVEQDAYVTDWLDLWEVDQDTRPKEAWGDEFDGTYDDTAVPFKGAFQGQAWGLYPKAPKRQAGARFISPDGQVQVTGADNHDLADLTDSTLSAYGYDLSGGTWTALRGNPVPSEDGKWDYSPLIILHESGDTVTAIRPGAAPEICTRLAFESEVLRCLAGKFLAFGALGAAAHSWPPQWCWADCGDDDRALIAWEPWRDSTRRANQQHPTWAWPARPARRPRLLSLGAPRPPLGLSLATIGAASADEPLKKGDGPLRLPVLAEVKDAAGEWQPAPDALKALAKRQLYQPAEWPEELDDRTGVRGEVRLTWRKAP